MFKVKCQTSKLLGQRSSLQRKYCINSKNAIIRQWIGSATSYLAWRRNYSGKELAWLGRPQVAMHSQLPRLNAYSSTCRRWLPDVLYSHLMFSHWSLESTTMHRLLMSSGVTCVRCQSTYERFRDFSIIDATTTKNNVRIPLTNPRQLVLGQNTLRKFIQNISPPT